MRRPAGPVMVLAMVVMVAGCRPSPPVSEQEVTAALQAVSAWLAVDGQAVEQFQEAIAPLGPATPDA